MMAKKLGRGLALVLAVCLLAVLAVACGGSGGGATVTVTESTTEAEAAPEAETGRRRSRSELRIRRRRPPKSSPASRHPLGLEAARLQGRRQRRLPALQDQHRTEGSRVLLQGRADLGRLVDRKQRRQRRRLGLLRWLGLRPHREARRRLLRPRGRRREEQRQLLRDLRRSRHPLRMRKAERGGERLRLRRQRQRRRIGIRVRGQLRLP